MKSILELRVRYCDTDQSGVVYHTRFFDYFEWGRTEFLRDLGMAYREMEDEGFFLVVVEADAKFISNTGYDTPLSVETELERATPVRIGFRYRVSTRESEPRLLVTGSTLLACIDRQGKPTRIPKRAHDLLAKNAPSAPSN